MLPFCPKPLAFGSFILQQSKAVDGNITTSIFTPNLPHRPPKILLKCCGILIFVLVNCIFSGLKKIFWMTSLIVICPPEKCKSKRKKAQAQALAYTCPA